MRIFIIGRGRARAGLPSHLNPAAAIPMLGNKKPKIGYADWGSGLLIIKCSSTQAVLNQKEMFTREYTVA